MITTNLNEMPSYSGLHYIMSNKLFTPKTILEVEQQYAQVDINHLVDDDFDINSILIDEPDEIAQQQEYWDERQSEEYQDTLDILARQVNEE